MRRRISLVALSAVTSTSLFVSSHALASTSAPVAPPISACPAPLVSGHLFGTLNSAPAIAGGGKTVALTFDDGPGRSTAKIISILQSFHVRATFFNIGQNISEWPALVRLESNDGYLLGNHTASHPFMPGLSAGQQAFQIQNVINKTWNLTRNVPCVFRPPYGSANTVTALSARARAETVWMWSDGGGDWKAEGSGSAYWINYIEKAVINQSRPQNHPVVLLHNQSISMPATVAALPVIIRSFLERGYTFVDLLGRDGPPNTCGLPSAATPVPLAAQLASGATLASGASLVSPNGEFQLTMQSSGDLVLSLSGGRSLWHSATSGHPGATAIMRPDGHLAVLSASSTVLWQSPGTATAGSNVQLTNLGKFSITHGAATTWAATGRFSTLIVGDTLHPGWAISSPDGRCRLFLYGNGELRLIGADGQRLWTDSVTGVTHATLTLQSDGNLLTRNAAGHVVWASSTRLHAHTRIVVTNRGTIQLLGSGGGLLWATQ